MAAETYFANSGRTFRKGRARLWYDREVKPRVLRSLFTLTGVYGRGKRNALDPVVRHVTFPFPDLPQAFDGFKILQISDLHIDQMDGLAEALAPLVAPLRPDLCVLTGDYRWEIDGPCDEVYPRVAKVLAAIQTRQGFFGILGNHDASEIAYHLETMGVRMLINEAVPLERAGVTIWLAGTDDPFDYYCGDLDGTLAQVPNDAFTVLLTHSPQLYPAAAGRGIKLYLCGHTHAGQLRVPLVGAVKKNAPVPRRFVQGAWTYHGMQGYTTAGAGCSTLPIRFNCPPEVVLIQLRRA